MIMPLPEVNELSSLGVRHLKRYWTRIMNARQGRSGAEDWTRDKTLLFGLGVGLHETVQFLMQHGPSLEEFEAWILQHNGGVLEPAQVSRLNAAMAGEDATDPEIEEAPDLLTSEDFEFWAEHGYVILHDAVPAENCRGAEQAIWKSINAEPNDPSTWYQPREDSTIWIPLIHDSALEENRRSIRVRKAFAQLWNRNDIWISVDRGGFNPPETPNWKFPGPNLHWDVSVAPPVPFGMQGILYLTDTTSEQGAFRCVPGFHHKINDWLRSLPSGTDARRQDLESLGSIAIAGKAGDLIIWRQELPHGSSPNRTTKPRIVQYISGEPSHWEINPVWL